MVIKIPVKNYVNEDVEMGALEFYTSDNTLNNGMVYFRLDGVKISVSQQDFNLLVNVVDGVKSGNKSQGFRTPC